MQKNCKPLVIVDLLRPQAARRVLRIASAVGISVLLPAASYAAEFYVAPTGSDSAAGTLAAPFATLAKANSAAAAGDTIWVRGGTYFITTQLVLSKSGTSDSKRTKIWAYPGEIPVLDASKYVTSNRGADVPVVRVSGDWMHLRGLEIANAKVGASGDHSYSLLRADNSSNNIYELLNLHHGFGPGLFIDTGTGGNLILNCDSHDNYDQNASQGDGQNGDGFGVHYQTTGPSTVISGCRAWMNSDDGYDFISQEVSVTIEGSFAIQNGRGSGGNGNGFKIGSSATGVRHIVQNDVAWNNRSAGFYANHSSGGNTWLNNTSYNNATQYNMLASPPNDSSATITLTGTLAHIMRNNVGFPNKNSNMGGVDSKFNTWDLNIAQASTDFESTTDTGCTGPRDADGSIPAACTFLKLKAGSPLIDKGTDVGLPFVGSAPDLGAYEYGATTSTGDGGITVTDGGKPSSGTGGSTVTNDGGGSPGGGGRGGAGGSSGTGGSSGAAGSSGSNGDTGGASAAGGAGGTPSGGSGGSVATGGSAGTMSGTRGSIAGDGASSPGCACSMGSRRSADRLLWTILAAAGSLALRRGRKHRSTGR